MRRFLGFILLLSLLALFACGGGSKNIVLPDNGQEVQDNSGDSDNFAKAPDIPFTTEEAAKRMPSSGYVPNEVLVKTALDADELTSVVEKYGYTVESKCGNYATVKVPDENLAEAIATLNREQTIFRTTINGVFRVPTEAVPLGDLSKLSDRIASFNPSDAYFGDTYVTPGWSTDPTDPENDTRYLLGQKMFLDMVSVPGAWDISLGSGATVAVIDGGMLVIGDSYEDLFIHAELRDNSGGTLVLNRLSHASARIAGDGTATTIDTIPDIITNVIDSTIYRTAADGILGITSSNINFNIIYGLNAPGAPDDPPERDFITSIPGVAPGADYLMVATGTIDTGAETPEWVYTADEIAASIDYAVDNGADVIIFGFWAPIEEFQVDDLTAIQDAVDNARASNIIVVAPIGFDARIPGPDDDPADFPYYDPGDPEADPPIPPKFTYYDSFAASDFVPAGLDGVLSVGASGISTPNFELNPPEAEGPYNYARHCAADANIYAPAYGQTCFYAEFNDENSFNYYMLRFGTEYSAAYAGGTVALMYSALKNADPTSTEMDETIMQILLNGDEANTGYFLFAANSVAIANNGGYDLVYPALNVTAELPASSNAITTNEPFSIEPVIDGGLGPYEILIDWGDGTTSPEDGEYEAWIPSTIYEKDGGYSSPGFAGLVLYAKDSREHVATGVAYLRISNPLSATPYVTETVDGEPIVPDVPEDPIPLVRDTDYIFHAGPAPNSILGYGTEVYTWDFGDGSPVTEENPIHSFSLTEDHTISLTIDDQIRPIFTVQFDVYVSLSL